MINTQIALIRREIWEHRAIYLTPLVIAALVLLGSLTGSFSVGDNKDIANLGMLVASNLGEGARTAAVLGILASALPLFFFAMLVLGAFYALDALYAERKDRSILFWRSLPVTDSATVISKLITAVLVIPLVTAAFAAVTQIGVMVISSGLVAAQDGSPWHLLWKPAPLLDLWIVQTWFILLFSIWMSPIAGWFLFVSGFVKRSPMLMAFLPLAVVPLMEHLLFRTDYFWDAVARRFVSMPVFTMNNDWSELESMMNNPAELQRLAESFDLLSVFDFSGFLFSPGFYIGLVVCGLFVASAIYVRRFRDDS
jgi:ABC-2 type transport system permease protein